MYRSLLISAGIFAVFACCSCGDDAPNVSKPSGSKELTFDSTDHRKVVADFYPSTEPNSEKVILMFHQAGSNAGEYETIEPVAASLGYNCIAVDQRSGGDMWGRGNRTISQSGTGEYLDAYHDLEGALQYAEGKNYTTIVAWGSSYSSSLVLKLAGENTTIKGVIAFSPGEYFDDKSLVKTWAANVSQPILFACTPAELSEGRQELFDAIHSDSKTLVDFPGGIHAVSTLLSDKSPAAGKYMDKVKEFLSTLKP